MAAPLDDQRPVGGQLRPGPAVGRGVLRQRRERVEFCDRPADRLQQLRAVGHPVAEGREQLAFELAAGVLEPENLAFPLLELVGGEPLGVLQRLDLAVVVGDAVGGRLPHLDVVAVRPVAVDGDVREAVAALLAVRERVEPLPGGLVALDQVVEFVVVAAPEQPAVRDSPRRLPAEGRVQLRVELARRRGVGPGDDLRDGRPREVGPLDRRRERGQERERVADGRQPPRVRAPAGGAGGQPLEVGGVTQQLPEPVARERRRRQRLDRVEPLVELPAVPPGAGEPLAQQAAARRGDGVVDRREQRPAVAVAAGHRPGQLEVALRGGVELDAVVGRVRPESGDRRQDARAGVSDVRERRARGPDRRTVVEPDAVGGRRAELLADRVRGAAGAERRRLERRHRGGRPLADRREQGVVVAGVRAGQQFGGVEPVQLRAGVRERRHRRDQEPARGDVDERQAVRARLAVPAVVGSAAVPGRVPALPAPVTVPAPDDRREVARPGVGRLQQRPGRHDAGHLAGVAAAGLVLVGDRHPVAPLDERREVRGEVVDRDARHRVRGAVRGLL